MRENQASRYRINLPLLFRLIDEEPYLKQEKGGGQEFSLFQYHEQICHHIENILNTRLIQIEWPSELSEIAQSVLNYGVEDFKLNYFGNKNGHIQLCQKIKEVICYFERRIELVKVVPVESDVELERILKTRIECEITLKPFSLHAIFESSLDLSKQTFYVES